MHQQVVTKQSINYGKRYRLNLIINSKGASVTQS